MGVSISFGKLLFSDFSAVSLLMAHLLIFSGIIFFELTILQVIVIYFYELIVLLIFFYLKFIQSDLQEGYLDYSNQFSRGSKIVLSIAGFGILAFFLISILFFVSLIFGFDPLVSSVVSYLPVAGVFFIVHLISFIYWNFLPSKKVSLEEDQKAFFYRFAMFTTLPFLVIIFPLFVMLILFLLIYASASFSKLNNLFLFTGICLLICLAVWVFLPTQGVIIFMAFSVTLVDMFSHFYKHNPNFVKLVKYDA